MVSTRNYVLLTVVLVAIGVVAIFSTNLINSDNEKVPTKELPNIVIQKNDNPWQAPQGASQCFGGDGSPCVGFVFYVPDMFIEIEESDRLAGYVAADSEPNKITVTYLDTDGTEVHETVVDVIDDKFEIDTTHITTHTVLMIGGIWDEGDVTFITSIRRK